MGVGWSLIFYAGCALFHFFQGVLPRLIYLFFNSRICLEHLGVVQESDHKALVIKVFWRCVL